MRRLLVIIGGLIMAYYGVINLQKAADKPLVDQIARLNKEIEQDKIQNKLEIDNAIVNRQLLQGMTPDQVLRSWGTPDTTKSSMIDEKNRFEIWIYGKTNIGFSDSGNGEGLRLSHLPQ